MIRDLGELKGPVLLFGGPYSNLQATLAIRREAERLGIPPERTICTGDVVAYFADVESTIDMVRNWDIHVLMGNCEESLGFSANDCGCGFNEGTTCDLLSRQWYAHADRQISESNRLWMQTLPRTLRFTWCNLTFTVVHGTLSSINQFVFPSTSDAVKQADIKRAETDCIIAGHCGLPFAQKTEAGYWLNAGVIGMPANDGTRDTWYALLDSDNGQPVFQLQRLTYDWHATVATMVEHAMDNGYAKALATGLWPSLDVLPNVERKQQGIPLAPLAWEISATKQLDY
ncbi:metallophosphoesterase family protein [Kistimonas asteriae]|uniref:metallophosphoesterase family protein n=1 Tax=Kistimonas asteriae TaxID=517724 RepID=UPI001BAE29FC|nr:metallophosphoesterase family protein [Kistimonas asteriae]